MIWTVAGIVCYARRRIGGIDRTGIATLLSRADRTVQQAFKRMSVDDGPGLVRNSGVREVTTRTGQVFLHDEERPYAPGADLVEMAYTVAELLEADRYHVESITVADELMLYAFDDEGDHVDPIAVEAARRQTATVRLESIMDGGPYQPLRVYVVDLRDDHDAATVAAAADRRNWRNEMQIAVAAGPICAVLRLDFRDDDEPFIKASTASRGSARGCSPRSADPPLEPKDDHGSTAKPSTGYPHIKQESAVCLVMLTMAVCGALRWAGQRRWAGGASRSVIQRMNCWTSCRCLSVSGVPA